jgi:hypothetical protein
MNYTPLGKYIRIAKKIQAFCDGFREVKSLLTRGVPFAKIFVLLNGLPV